MKLVVCVVALIQRSKEGELQTTICIIFINEWHSNIGAFDNLSSFLADIKLGYTASDYMNDNILKRNVGLRSFTVIV